MDDHRRWRIAVHEAGHAVCARLLGLPRCGGACVVEPFAKAEFDCDCGERSMIALMGGAAAEVIVFGDHHPKGFTNDWRRVTGRLKRAGGDGGVAMLWAQTMGLPRPHEGLICRVARGLVSSLALTGDEIDALVYYPAPSLMRKARGCQWVTLWTSPP